MPVPLKCCCADVLLVHQQKEHNEASNSVNQIGFGLALCGALLYKLKWGLISGCSFSKASLVAGLWPVFSKAMRSWHNLFLISSTLHLCLHKPNKNSTKQKNRILAKYLQIFYGGPRVLENPLFAEHELENKAANRVGACLWVPFIPAHRVISSCLWSLHLLYLNLVTCEVHIH